MNRLFDDRSQIRIALEAQAMESVLLLIDSGVVNLVASEALRYEISRNPYPERKAVAQNILQTAEPYQPLTPDIRTRASVLEASDRIKAMDALHVACAEYMQVDYFLTCDDRLVKRYQGSLQMCNPIQFILMVTTTKEL